MLRTPLSKPSDDQSITPFDHPKLENLTDSLHAVRAFKTIDRQIFQQILRQGELCELAAEETLAHKLDAQFSEVYILASGVLAIMSDSKIIKRVDTLGEVIDELSMTHTTTIANELVAETDCQLIAFSNETLQVDPASSQISIYYFLLIHILSDKLRLSTAQSLLQNNERIRTSEKPQIAIIDSNATDRIIIKGAVQTVWSEATFIEYPNPQYFIDTPLEHDFDLLICDVFFDHHYKDEKLAIENMIAALKMRKCPIFILSSYCNHPIHRLELAEQKIDEFIGKPYSVFDLKHYINKFRAWYYKFKELHLLENAEDRDPLTGLANRKRLYAFLEALFTVRAENQKSFSIIVGDVDHFKIYNETYTQEQGDYVLIRIANLFTATLRKGDLAAYDGGKGFIIVLPTIEQKGAVQVAEKLRQIVEHEYSHPQYQALGTSITMTLGLASFPQDAIDVDPLITCAETRMREGKKAGKNCVVGFS